LLGIGVFFTFVPSTHGKDDLPPGLGWVFAGIGFVGFTIMIGLAVLKVRVAQCLKRRHSRTFCMVMAGILCLGVPYGTLLGVFTFLVMARPSVKRLFESG
jgi:threonine/homoserine/homoserine lactone efflux protein